MSQILEGSKIHKHLIFSQKKMHIFSVIISFFRPPILYPIYRNLSTRPTREESWIFHEDPYKTTLSIVVWYDALTGLKSSHTLALIRSEMAFPERHTARSLKTLPRWLLSNEARQWSSCLQRKGARARIIFSTSKCGWNSQCLQRGPRWPVPNIHIPHR